MKKVFVVGIGPGALEYITPMAMEVIKDSDLLIGGKRNLDTLSFLGKDIYDFKIGMEVLKSIIEKERRNKRICVVVSGDPCFYSMLDYLIKSFGKNSLKVISGISSFQYLFCSVAKSWRDYTLASVHGRNTNIVELLMDNKGVFLLTDKINTPSNIAKLLVDEGLCDCTMIIGENLSYKDEKISELRLEDVVGMEFSDLCVVVIEKNEMEL